MEASLLTARRGIAERLRARREEVEEAIATRLWAIADPSELSSPGYADGLRDALASALGQAIGTLERGGDSAPELPPPLLAQARLAARRGVSLDTVLRRCLAGHSLLDRFIVEEANAVGPEGRAVLGRLLGEQAAVFDRVIEAVGEEHRREAERPRGSREERRAERVRRLLVGEALDASDLGYALDGWHVGVVGNGAVSPILERLVATLDARLLRVSGEEGEVWVWLGSRRELGAGDVAAATALAEAAISPGSVLAFGEPARGVGGWRLSHRQAAAAAMVARTCALPVARYATVALLASALSDRLLAESLRQLYVAPLRRAEDRRQALADTVLAYLAADRNLSSTAAALGINRKTVRKRIERAEARLGQQIPRCSAELEIALRLENALADRTHRG